MKLLIGLLLLRLLYGADVRCSTRTRCNALGSYYVWRGSNLTFISTMVQVSVHEILRNNPQIPNQDSVLADTRIRVPFSCECLRGGEYLGHVFNFSTFTGSTYTAIAETYYANLTTIESLRSSNSYQDFNIPDTGVPVNVPVNCSCGDRNISPEYGLFITYPLRGETLERAAQANNISADVVRRYNPAVNESSGNSVLFIPARDRNGSFVPLDSSRGGLATSAIVGISIGGIVVVLLFTGCLYVQLQRKKNKLLSTADAPNVQVQDSVGGITVNKSVKFSYEELAIATNGFDIANKIGEGGFGAVYYAELRGEKAAIKKMGMKASKEFLAELKVLTRAHHCNLVRLIGYCIERYLFLVYEFIDNGNLSQHLRGNEPLPWSIRLQIAIDSARGLEYIHEHSVPVCIHGDIKPANILLDKTFHAKVADFGLTKLTLVGSNSLPTSRVTGTFGYMPPEYVRYCHVSPKLDVYAFGVVLYELISGKEAIVKGTGSNSSSEIYAKGLIAVFEEVLSRSESSEGLTELVDPRLGDNYPLDQLQKIVRLARACTNEAPNLRPSMRSIVVTLMTLSAPS